MPKTIDQILTEIHAHRPMSRPHLYQYIRALAIRPPGARQRPQRYPDDAAARILSHLGFHAPTDGKVLPLSVIKKARAA